MEMFSGTLLLTFFLFLGTTATGTQEWLLEVNGRISPGFFKRTLLMFFFPSRITTLKLLVVNRNWKGRVRFTFIKNST